MKSNTLRGAAQRYVSKMNVAQKEGDLAFLSITARSFDGVINWRRPVVPVVRPLASRTIFEISMAARAVARG